MSDLELQIGRLALTPEQIGRYREELHKLFNHHSGVDALCDMALRSFAPSASMDTGTTQAEVFGGFADDTDMIAAPSAVAQEPIGVVRHVKDMSVTTHHRVQVEANLYIPLPDGTKLYAAPFASMEVMATGWQPINTAPMYVQGRDALIGEWAATGWKKVSIWEREWTRDEIMKRGGTHWWPHLKELPSPDRNGGEPA